MLRRPTFHQHQWIPARPNDKQHNCAEKEERTRMENSWLAEKAPREPRLKSKATNKRTAPSFYSLAVHLPRSKI